MEKVYIIDEPRKVVASSKGEQAVVTIPKELVPKLAGKWVVLKIRVVDTHIE